LPRSDTELIGTGNRVRSRQQRGPRPRAPSDSRRADAVPTRSSSVRKSD